MGYQWLTDLDQALASAGLAYVEVGYSGADPTGAADWRSRGRPYSTGSFDPAGVLCHHTASPKGTSTASDLNVILAGNSGAPGPISQLYIARDGQLHIVAAGRANHGGGGRRPGIDTGPCADMNAALLGIEVGNDGVGEYWPDVQTECYGRTVAALCTWYGWDIHSAVFLHATTGPPSGGCNSKIDPAGPWQLEPWLPGGANGTWNLDTWRDWCASFVGGAPTPTPPPDEGDDSMPAYINKGTYAVFAMTGGMCHWIPTSEDADRLGVSAADANGRRGTYVSDEFFQNLILVGPFPSEPGWWVGHFRAWWPDGTPQSAQTAYPVTQAQVAAASRAPDA